jgi:hypothetical protein
LRRYAFKIYWAFMLSQALLSVVMPGVTVNGLRFTEAGRAPAQLSYLCNGYTSFYATLVIVAALRWFERRVSARFRGEGSGSDVA